MPLPQTVRAITPRLKTMARNHMGMLCCLALAIVTGIICLFLNAQLTAEKKARTKDFLTHKQTIIELQHAQDQAKTHQAHTQTTSANAIKQAQQREAKLREQLLALGVVNDRIITWIARSRSTNLPELRASSTDAKILEQQLVSFLKTTEDDNHFQPIRARITMQLAELAIHQNKPTLAHNRIREAKAAWKQAGIKEPQHNYRVTRAQLVVLIQALDQNNQTLISQALPETRDSVNSLISADPLEISRMNATMQIINGRLIQTSNPTKALEHFLLAIKDLKGVSEALPDNTKIRTELAHYYLQSASLADDLNLIENATQLRGTAAKHLRLLIKKNPKLQLAQVKLAEINLLEAEALMRAGHDDAGIQKLSAAEAVLKQLPATDTKADGAAMQMAIAKGLRAMMLRDQRRITDATKNLDTAISITQKITDANPNAPTALYRLAAFKWQRAGLSGDAGNVKEEIKLGNEAAILMQQLLQQGAGKRDTEVRRSLAYLHGDLGHNISKQGNKQKAAQHFKNAAQMWHNLIQKNGSKEEYNQGLKWCQQRYKQIIQN